MKIRFLTPLFACFITFSSLHINAMEAPLPAPLPWQATAQKLSTTPRDVFECFPTTGKILQPITFSQENTYINFGRTDHRSRDIYPQEPVEHIFRKAPTAPRTLSEWAECLADQNPEDPSIDHDIYADMLLACAFCDYKCNIFPHDIYAMFDRGCPHLDIDVNYGTECIDQDFDLI